MSASRKIGLLLLVLCCVPLIASADVLMLKSGETVTGRFQGADQTSVSFLINGQTRRYQISEINSITFTPSSTASSYPDGSTPDSRPTVRRRAPYNGPDQNSGPVPSPTADSGSGPYDAAPAGESGQDDRPSLRRRPGPPIADDSTMSSSGPYPANPAPPPPLGVTVHAGSVITIRMIDPVDSSINQVGQTFRASLDEPLVVDGETIAQRGAEVTAKLVSKAEAGRVSGRSQLDLALMDININGRRYVLSTSDVSQSGSSRGKQSAERVGGGAVLGAIIGAIAGGGRGAAIGATTGAGAGTAVQVLTHGDKVKIPAETRLEFTLAQPLNL